MAHVWQSGNMPASKYDSHLSQIRHWIPTGWFRGASTDFHTCSEYFLETPPQTQQLLALWKGFLTSFVWLLYSIRWLTKLNQIKMLLQCSGCFTIFIIQAFQRKFKRAYKRTSYSLNFINYRRFCCNYFKFKFAYNKLRTKESAVFCKYDILMASVKNTLTL